MHNSVTEGAAKAFPLEAPPVYDAAIYEELRDHARALAEKILANTRDSREQHLAMTRLQSCVRFACLAPPENGEESGGRS